MKKIENTTVATISQKHYYNHKVELRIGNWKKHLDLNYVNTIIAMALNHCSKHNEFIINGYLITTHNLYLVAKTDNKTFEDMLTKIELHIPLLLQAHDKDKHKPIFIDDDDEDIFYRIYEPLFKLYPLKNDYLIPLLTGKTVVLPYYNRELEDLRFIIRHHPFCSAIDYSGAIGPVAVTLLEE